MHNDNKSSKTERSCEMTQISYPSFITYIEGIFKSSLITSFPEIATTKSFTKRLVKSMVFVVCTIGFTYQTLDFLKMYLSYPTVVNVQITNPYMVDQPGITVCNTNRMRRSSLCSKKESDCTPTQPDIFCAMHTILCPRNDPSTAYPYMPYTSVLENEYFWELIKAEVHNESMFKECFKRLEGNKIIPCNKPYTSHPVIMNNEEPNYCYTTGSQYGHPDAQPDRYANFFTMEIQLYTQPEEHIFSTKPIKMQIALHDRKSRINPYIEGYSIRSGIQYSAFISMVSKERLPYPYDTNCIDYFKKWKENNGTGPLNEIVCVEQCKLNKLVENGSCIDITVNYPHEKPLCQREISVITGEILAGCYSECGYACSDSYYEVQFQEIGNYDHECPPEDIWCKHHLISIVFNFLKFRHTKYIYEPKFESIELYSYVGGYMGMWLGLSLISLFDLFETLIYMIVYPISRALHRRQKIKKVDSIGSKSDDMKYCKSAVVY